MGSGPLGRALVTIEALWVETVVIIVSSTLKNKGGEKMA